MKYLAGLAAILPLLSGSVAAQDRVELAPASNWEMNYDEDACALQRPFGEEGQRVYLELRQFSPTSAIQTLVASADFADTDGIVSFGYFPLEEEPNARSTQFGVEYADGIHGKVFSSNIPERGASFVSLRDELIWSDAFTPEESELLSRWYALESSDERDDLYENPVFTDAADRFGRAFRENFILERSRVMQEDSVEGLMVDGAFDRDLFLRTGSLHAPMQAMRTCLEELMHHWGIDVEAHRSLSRRVEVRNYERMTDELRRRYPRKMLRKDIGGFLHVRMDVSAEGDVTGCHMQSPMNDETFEETACNTLSRYARFEPALDAEGVPIASYHQMSIRYVTLP